MNFKLTEEDKNYIISEYGGSERIISIIEGRINSLEIITEQEDYVELIIAVVCQHESIKDIVNLKPNKEEKNKHFMNINQIIYSEILRKYTDFDKFQNGTEEKVKKILKIK